jgi:hypothetical protein
VITLAFKFFEHLPQMNENTEGFFKTYVGNIMYNFEKKNNNACAEQYIVPKSEPHHNALPDEKPVCWMLF